MKKLFFILLIAVTYASSIFAYEVNEHTCGNYSGYYGSWTNTQRGLLSFQLNYDVIANGYQLAGVTAYVGNIYSPGQNLSAKYYSITPQANGSQNSPIRESLSCGSYWDHFVIGQENWNTTGSFPYVDNWIRIDLF